MLVVPIPDYPHVNGRLSKNGLTLISCWTSRSSLDGVHTEIRDLVAIVGRCAPQTERTRCVVEYRIRLVEIC